MPVATPEAETLLAPKLPGNSGSMMGSDPPGNGLCVELREGWGCMDIITSN